MNHLIADEILELAEITMMDEVYSDDQLTKMEHLKTCKVCFDKYEIALSTMNVMGTIHLRPTKIVEKKEQKSVSLPVFFQEEKPEGKVKAAIRVMREQVNERLNAVMEQISYIGSDYCFETQPAFATRGVDGKENPVVRIDDISDDKTFIAFDAVENKMMIQIHQKDNSNCALHAELTSKNGKTIVFLEKEGRLYKGVVNEAPEDSFTISIIETVTDIN